MIIRGRTFPVNRVTDSVLNHTVYGGNVFTASEIKSRQHVSHLRFIPSIQSSQVPMKRIRAQLRLETGARVISFIKGVV